MFLQVGLKGVFCDIERVVCPLPYCYEVLLFLAHSGVLGHFVMLFSFSPSFLGCCESCGMFLCNQTLSGEALEC